MKKLMLIFALIVMSFGCKKELKEFTEIDYNGYGYAVWVNDSEHTIKIMGYSFYNSSVEMDEEIAPGESLTVMEIGMGSAPYPVPSPLSVVFDGKYEVVFSSIFSENETIDGVPTNYDDRFRLNWFTNYIEETVKDPEGCRQCEGIRWTYTFTNADFVAALEYNEAQQEAAE